MLGYCACQSAYTWVLLQNHDVFVPFKDEDDMTSDSATHLPTQQSVKAYVDTKTAGLADIGLIIALG